MTTVPADIQTPPHPQSAGEEEEEGERRRERREREAVGRSRKRGAVRRGGAEMGKGRGEDEIRGVITLKCYSR